MKYVNSEKLTVVMATHNNELANNCKLIISVTSGRVSKSQIIELL